VRDASELSQRKVPLKIRCFFYLAINCTFARWI